MAPRLPATVLVAALFTAPYAGPANADSVEHAGRRCDSVVDPVGSTDAVARLVVHGGPWFAADLVDDSSPGDEHGAPAGVILECRIIVTSANSLTCAQSPAVTVSATGNGVAVLATQVELPLQPSEWYWVCTRVTMSHGGTTQVYDTDDTVSRP